MMRRVQRSFFGKRIFEKVAHQNYLSSFSSTLLFPQQKAMMSHFPAAPSETENILKSMSTKPNNGSKYDLVELDFTDIKKIYEKKSTCSLLRGIFTLSLCRMSILVKHSHHLVKLQRKVLGDRITYSTFLKWTFFNHFCAGTDSETIKPAVKKLAVDEIGSILDYAAEAEAEESTPILYTSIEAPLNLSMTSLVTNTSIHYADKDADYEANFQRTFNAVKHAAHNLQPGGIGFVAVKFTGMCHPHLLARCSALLLSIRRSWVLNYTHLTDVPKLEDCRVMGDKLPQEGRWASREEFAVASRKINPQLSHQELEQAMNYLDPKSTGRIYYFDYTRMMGRGLLQGDIKHYEALKPLLQSIPHLTDAELKMVQKFRERIRALMTKANEENISVMVDAEQTFYQCAIDHFVRNLQREFNKEKPTVYNTFQCYLKYAPQRVKNDLDRANIEGWIWAAKMVRGAYVLQERSTAGLYDYPSPICDEIEGTHQHFDDLMVQLVNEACNTERSRPIGAAFCTHNKSSCEFGAHYIRQRQHDVMEGSQLSFAQLYGMRDDITLPLAHAGYPTFKYVPYGPVKETMEYLIRRAQENSGGVGGGAEETKLMCRELRRRLGLSWLVRS